MAFSGNLPALISKILEYVNFDILWSDIVNLLFNLGFVLRFILPVKISAGLDVCNSATIEFFQFSPILKILKTTVLALLISLITNCLLFYSAPLINSF